MKGDKNTPAARAERNHRSKAPRQKSQYELKDLRDAGRVPVRPDLWVESGRRWRGAHRYIPLSIWWIQGCCAVAILAASFGLVSVLMRDPPVLLLTYPDGSIRCAPTPVDPATQQPKKRRSAEAAQCAFLALKFGE